MKFTLRSQKIQFLKKTAFNNDAGFGELKPAPQLSTLPVAPARVSAMRQIVKQWHQVMNLSWYLR